jgi:glycosyltransferase involved in cell wall biosynthesis
LLVNSPAYTDYLVSKGVPPGKINFIPNGVDSSMFHPEAKGEAVRKRLSLDGKFVVTYAGALGPANDIETLLNAAKVVNNQSDIHFLIVGDGRQRANLEKRKEEIGLKNVTFAGACSKAEMPSFLAASDACIAILQNIPMFKTTYPNKVFDYMAAGRPTILVIDGVIRVVIEESGGGIFVPPGDYLALTDAVERLKRNPQAAKRMGRQARAYAMQHFERAKQAEDFVDLIKTY